MLIVAMLVAGGYPCITRRAADLTGSEQSHQCHHLLAHVDERHAEKLGKG